jgi:hypothetical protein
MIVRKNTKNGKVMEGDDKFNKKTSGRALTCVHALLEV